MNPNRQKHPQKGLKFENVSAFMAYLDEPTQEIVMRLREIVGSHGLKEKLSYNVPFYYGRKRVFYIWPSCIPWGGISEGVAVGFCYGQYMEDPYLLFAPDQTQIMRKIILHNTEDGPWSRLHDYVDAAIALDRSGLY